jgi:hypothetical protein
VSHSPVHSQKSRYGVLSSGLPASELEVCATAAIDPDAIPVKSPALALNTGRPAALVHHANTVLGRNPAKMALTVIGGTGNLASVLCGDAALRVHAETTECK